MVFSMEPGKITCNSLGTRNSFFGKVMSMAYRTSWYPHFLDETIETPWALAQRPFVHSVNPIWTKSIDHAILIKKYFVKKSLKMWLL
jgi:hypothetical protein